MLVASVLLAAVMVPASRSQTRSGTEPAEDPTATLATTVKKQKKMPQVGRDKIKKAKIKMASEYELSADGTDSTLTAITEFDSKGNAFLKRTKNREGAFDDETVVVDPDLDVVKKITRNADATELDLEYDPDTAVTFIRMKKNGLAIGHMQHEYDGSGRLHRIYSDMADSTGRTPARYATTELAYDALDNVSEVVTRDHRVTSLNPSGDRPVARVRHTYDADGLVERTDRFQTDLLQVPPGPDVLTLFTLHEYDTHKRLVRARSFRRYDTGDSLVAEETHAFDTDGNEMETAHLVPLAGVPDTLTAFAPGLTREALVASLPRLSVLGVKSTTTSRMFDSFGNITSETTEEKVRGVTTARKVKRTKFAKFD